MRVVVRHTQAKESKFRIFGLERETAVHVVSLLFGGLYSDDTAYYTSTQDLFADITRSIAGTSIRLHGDNGDG
jgi:hypothetical protein